MTPDSYPAALDLEPAASHGFAASPRQAARAYGMAAPPAEPTSQLAAERQELILRHTSLVEHVVRQFSRGRPTTLSRQDLLGYGVIGLIEAVDRFDPGVGVKFETFAVRRIWGAIVDAMREQGFLPRGVAQRVRELNAASAALEQELSRAPTTAEVAKRLGADVESIEATRRASQIGMISLETPVGNGSGDGDTIELRDLIADEIAEPTARIEEAEQASALKRAIDELPERERLVVSLYYHEELTLKEIGRVLDVTESRVSQLHTAAVGRLRAALNMENGGGSARPSRRAKR